MARSAFCALAVGAAVCGPGAVSAQVNDYTPGTANNGGQTISVNGGTASLDGEIAFSGSTPVNASGLSLAEAYRRGFLTGGADPAGLFAVGLGAQNVGVSVVDPITQGTFVVNTYANDRLTQGAVRGMVTVYEASSGTSSIFIDASLANVSGGGTFNMNASGQIGDTTVKDTTYIKVTDGTANWNSNNTVVFSGNGATPQSLLPYNMNLVSSSYSGTFTVQLADGPHTQTVGNLAQFKAYNTWLIAQLGAGKLGSGANAQAAYDAAIAQAYTNSTNSYQATPTTGPIAPDDPLLKPLGQRIAMLADGPTATGHVTATGVVANIQSSGGGTLLMARNGGLIINDGTVTSTRSTTVGMAAESGGRLVNNGVRNLGEQGSAPNAEMDPDIISGVNTTYVNNGIVNLAAWTYDATNGNVPRALRVLPGASATNNGAMNMGTRSPTGRGGIIGVILESGREVSRFTNGADGVIYVGRAASADLNAAPLDRGGIDVAMSTGATAIYALSNSTARNDGTIVIGDKVQGGIGIRGEGSLVNVVNAGTIDVNGHYDASPLANIGMRSVAGSDSRVENAGTINLRGVNNIGIQAVSGGLAVSSGVINVLAGVDAASGLRDYAIWSEGTGSKVTLSGTVNLSGDGAIGVHARSGGSVAVSGAGMVNFGGGIKQTGYFAYGPDAQISNNSTSAQVVSTEGSTLFRVEDGADFTGAASATSALTASGKNSIAMLMTGTMGADVSAFNSGGMTINLQGEGATGVRVEGGAQGKVASTAVINMNDPRATGAVAGIADGQKFDLSGNAVGAIVGGVLANGRIDAGAAGFGTGTILVSGATLTSDLSGVTGYIARNGAEVNNSGDIIFTGDGATGLLVEAGARGGNSGTITVGAGGTGIRARDPSGLLVTNVNTSGNLILNGGDISNRSVGISAAGPTPPST